MSRLQNLTPSKQTGISGRGVFILLAIMGCALGLWWLFTGITKAPVLVSPENSVAIRGFIGQDTGSTIKWRHGGITSERRFPNRATRYVVCFYDTNVSEDCGGDDSDIFFVSEEATEIQRTRISSSSFAYSVIDRIYPFYEYTYEVTLPASSLDLPLMWTVGACSGGMLLDNCTLAAPGRQLGITARNLVAVKIDDDKTDTGIEFEVQLQNTGDTTSEPYQVSTVVWQILHEPNETQPLTEIPDTIDDTDIVITTEGEEVQVSEFRNGNRPLGDIFAIQKPGTDRVDWFHEYPAVPNPLYMVPTPVTPCGLSQCLYNLDPNERPALLAAFFKVDPNNVLLEFDETDNVKKKNTIRAPRL